MKFYELVAISGFEYASHIQNTITWLTEGRIPACLKRIEEEKARKTRWDNRGHEIDCEQQDINYAEYQLRELRRLLPYVEANPQKTFYLSHENMQAVGAY